MKAKYLSFFAQKFYQLYFKSDMTLRKTYIVWFIALVTSSFIGTGSYLAAMKITYGNTHGDDLDGLPYFIGSLVLIVFLTGLISAYLVHVLSRKKKSRENVRLVRSLAATHSTCTLFAILAFPFAFVYFNIFGFLFFFFLPVMSWKIAHDTISKKWIKIFIGCLLGILIMGAFSFLMIVISNPFKP
jgi:cation transport ATPase